VPAGRVRGGAGRRFIGSSWSKGAKLRKWRGIRVVSGDLVKKVATFNLGNGVSVVGNGAFNLGSQALAGRGGAESSRNRLSAKPVWTFRMRRGAPPNRSPSIRVRSAECGVRSAECGVRSAECGVRHYTVNYFSPGTYAGMFTTSFGAGPSRLLSAEFSFRHWMHPLRCSGTGTTNRHRH
jgi:hypothetical protein